MISDDNLNWQELPLGHYLSFLHRKVYSQAFRFGELDIHFGLDMFISDFRLLSTRFFDRMLPFRDLLCIRAFAATISHQVMGNCLRSISSMLKAFIQTFKWLNNLLSEGQSKIQQSLGQSNLMTHQHFINKYQPANYQHTFLNMKLLPAIILGEIDMAENSQDNIYESRETGQLKNQYSTFIEQLQETTQKLMEEVFNAQYQPQQDDDTDLDKIKTTARTHRNKYQNIYTNRDYDTGRYGRFTGFLIRNQKWSENRGRKIDRELEKKKKMISSTMTEIPMITRGSIEKLDPIYERCLDIQQQRQQKLAFRRIDKKKAEQEKFNQITFQPTTCPRDGNYGPRSLQQYLKDKEQWVKKKNDVIKIKKMISEARKYEECIFTPVLTTENYNQKHKMCNREGKIEERLLRSLEKSIEKYKCF